MSAKNNHVHLSTNIMKILSLITLTLFACEGLAYSKKCQKPGNSCEIIGNRACQCNAGILVRVNHLSSQRCKSPLTVRLLPSWNARRSF